MRFSQFLLAVGATVALSVGHADIQKTFISAGASDANGTQSGYYNIEEHENQRPTVQQGSVTFTNADVAKYPSYSGSYTGTTTSSSGFSAVGNSWMSHKPVLNARSTSGWGMRSLLGTTRHHSGVDLAVPSGTPIYATGPGIVTKSGWGTGYGQYIDIDHGNGYTTRYAHASRLIARVGQQVKAGEHIANVGCTGRCTGPHLHFEVLKNNKRQNPSTFLAMLP